MSWKSRTPAQKAAWKKLKPWVKKQIKKQPLNIWARRIRKMFSYKCAWCSKTSKLEAHHIYFKSLYPSLKEDLGNGIILCLSCHDKIHSLYIKDQPNYWILINDLLKKVTYLKSLSLKKQNPSGHKYQVGCYQYLEPEGQQINQSV